MLNELDFVTMAMDEDRRVTGRVIHIQTNPLNNSRRIRVIDDFETPATNTVAEAVCSENATDTIAGALRLAFGAERLIYNGTFSTGSGVYRYNQTPLGIQAENV